MLVEQVIWFVQLLEYSLLSFRLWMDREWYNVAAKVRLVSAKELKIGEKLSLLSLLITYSDMHQVECYQAMILLVR